MLRLLRHLPLVVVLLRVIRVQPPAGFNLIPCLELADRCVVVILEHGKLSRSQVFKAGTSMQQIENRLLFKCMELGAIPQPATLDIGEVALILSAARLIDCGGDQP